MIPAQPKEQYAADGGGVASPEPNRDLLQHLNTMRESGFRANSDRLAYYQDGLKYIYGNQLEDKDIKEGWDRIVANAIFPGVMQDLAYQAQRKQTVIGKPVENADTDKAKVWTAHFKWLYQRELKMHIKLLRAALDGAIYGKYILYNYWDAQADWDETTEQWVGALRSRLLCPEYVATDPECEDDPHQGRYIITRRRMPIEDALARWPKFAESIEGARSQIDKEWFLPDLAMSSAPYQDNADLGTDLQADDASTRLSEMLTSSHYRHHTGMAHTDGAAKSNYITFEQYWFRDPATATRKTEDQVPEEELLADGKIVHDPQKGGFLDAETGKPMLVENWPKRPGERDIPMYPRGRFVLRIGDTILNPKPEEQAWRFRRWPFAFGFNQILPHSSEGLNAVEMARNLQDRVNLAARHLMNVVKFFSDPVVNYEKGTFADGGQPVNRAGACREVNKNMLDKIRREQPTEVSPGLMALAASWKADLRDITGAQEVGMGRPGQGQQTAREIIMLQQNTKLRSGMSNILLDEATIVHFENLAEQAQRMYTVGQIIRIVGEKNADTVHTIQEDDKSVRMDIALDIATTLPFDQDRNRQEAGELYDRIGPPFLPELLEAYEIENADEIMERVEVYQMIQQAIEEQEAAGNEPGRPA